MVDKNWEILQHEFNARMQLDQADDSCPLWDAVIWQQYVTIT